MIVVLFGATTQSSFTEMCLFYAFLSCFAAMVTFFDGCFFAETSQKKRCIWMSVTRSLSCSAYLHENVNVYKSNLFFPPIWWNLFACFFFFFLHHGSTVSLTDIWFKWTGISDSLNACKSDFVCVCLKCSYRKISVPSKIFHKVKCTGRLAPYSDLHCCRIESHISFSHLKSFNLVFPFFQIQISVQKSREK